MVEIEIRKSNLVWGRFSAFVSFNDDLRVLRILKALPEKYYSDGIIEIPLDKVPVVERRVKGIEVPVTVIDNREDYELTSVELPEGFTFKTTPFEHQKQGVLFGLEHEKWFLGDEQGLGKALALDTKIPTYPNGYKLMKDIEVGDYVFGKNGKPTKVTATYNHKNVEMYRFTFSDGVAIDCCKDHLWKIHTQHGYKVVDTNWFLQKNQFGVVRKDKLFSGGSYNYYIDRCEPIQFKFIPVKLDPYILGALLGDGSLTGSAVSFTTKDQELVTKINSLLPDGYFLHSSPSMSDIAYNIVNLQNKPNPNGSNIVKQWLKELKIMGTTSHNKFIPDLYKYNSPDIRLKVLQGLLDTDGYATRDNLVQYTSVSKQLAEDVRFLVESLGGMCNWYEGNCGYDDKITGIAYTLTIRADDPSKLFTLTRKKSLLKPRRFKPRRQIVSIEKIENADAKCITVDSEDHLYLAEHCVVTHNTKQIIDIAVARKIKYGYKHCLIICGVNTLKWNWAAEVTKHSNEKAHILGQRVRKRSKKLYIGSMKDKIEDLKHIDELPYFIITNIESFRNKDFAELVKKLCNKDKISMSAADEMHKMKNPQGQQTKGFMKCLPEVQIGMTGTPLMNNPLDLYIILKWLGYENHTYGAFKNHYCIMGGFGGYEVIGYRNMNELSDKIRNIMLRRLKSDVLDLPEKTYIDEYLDMTDRQAIIYSEVKSDIKAHIDEIKFDNNPLNTLIRLRQATGYTGILSSEIKESVKLDRMVDIVDEAIANGDQVVIFSNWTKMTDVIAEHIKYPYSVITGQTGDNIRQQNVNDFQEGKSKVIIGTIGAMGTGLTLTAAHTVIFLDEPWNKALFDQAVDRVHRIGTNGTVTIYSLMCKDTIDERIHEIIYKKGAMSDAVIDGKIVGDKNAILTYLLD